MPRIIYALLCDAVHTDAKTQKHTIVGTFDRFTITNFDAPVSRFAIFCRIGLDDHEPHILRMDLRGPEDQIVTVVTGRINAGVGVNPTFRQPTFHFNVHLEKLLLIGPGRYAFVVHIDEQEIGEIPFYAGAPGEPKSAYPTEQPPPSSQSPSSSES